MNHTFIWYIYIYIRWMIVVGSQRDHYWKPKSRFLLVYISHLTFAWKRKSKYIQCMFHIHCKYILVEYSMCFGDEGCDKTNAIMVPSLVSLSSVFVSVWCLNCCINYVTYIINYPNPRFHIYIYIWNENPTRKWDLKMAVGYSSEVFVQYQNQQLCAGSYTF